MEADRQPEGEGRGITLRAILVGSVCAFCLSAGAAYAILYLQGSYMALGTSMPGAVFLLYCLTFLINPALKFIHPRAGLNRRELLLVYLMMVMTSPIPTHLVRGLLNTIASPVYYTTPENQWSELILPHIPHWLMPHDPQVGQLFYEGMAEGQAIPWDVWQPHFLVWTPFVWGMFLMVISMMVIMRKQWIEHERLIYPLMQVPLAMTEEGGKGEFLSPFFKNPVMWAGFAVPALWGTLHGLYNYFPHLIPVAQSVDPIRFDVDVFNRTVDLYVALRFNILGFFYFVKTEIAFSLWFFNLLSYLARGIFGMMGVVSSDPAGGGHAVQHIILAHNAMGALLVLLAGGLWTARSHLRGILRKTFLNDPQVDDSDEILSYRAAVIMLLASSSVMIGWMWVAGMPVWVGVALLFVAVVTIYGYSRVVAESGLSDGSPPVNPQGILISAIGSSVIGPQGLVIMSAAAFWTGGRNFVMVAAANSLRLGEEFVGSRRPLFWVMLLALAVATGGATWMIMTLSHDYGGINVRLGAGGYSYPERLIRTAVQPQAWFWINTGIGSVLMTLLMIARRLYVWWPLHPVGYAIGPIWIMDHLWFNMLLAWFIKVMVLKYGGVRLYLKTRPFFMGMILGYFTPGGFFLVADHFTGMTGNVIFWG